MIKRIKKINKIKEIKRKRIIPKPTLEILKSSRKN